MEEVFTYIMMILVYLFWFFPKWHNDQTFLFKTLFYIYICMVIEVTVLPINISMGIHLPQNGILEYANFQPFIDLIKKHSLAKTEIFLNILMMIPFGILYPLAFNEKNTNTIFKVFMFSLLIECIQLFMAAFMMGTRTFDVTDLITNLIGGIIGVVFISIILKIRQMRN